MTFRVIDLRDKMAAPETDVEAASPEDAARQVVGVPVFRGGHTRDLVARVYWSTAGGRNMVRLYSKPIER